MQMTTKKSYRYLTHAFLDVSGQQYEIDGYPAVLLLLLVDRPDGISRLEMMQAAPPPVAMFVHDHVSALRRRGIPIKTIRSSKGPEHLRYQLSGPVLIASGALIWDTRLERLGGKSRRPCSGWAEIQSPPRSLGR
jgi:hypothetical protein